MSSILFAKVADWIWPKIVIGALPSIGRVLTFARDHEKRNKWSRNTTNQIGHFGKLYMWVNTIPQGLISFLSTTIIVYSLFTVFIGILEVSESSLLEKDWMSVPKAATDYYLWVVILGFPLLAVVSTFNWIPKFLLFLTQRYSDDVGWTNAYWHVNNEEDAIPLNINRRNCNALASRLLDLAIEKPRGTDRDKAVMPNDLDRQSIANALLVSATIEGCLYDLKIYDVTMAEIYDALFRFARNKKHGLSSKDVKRYINDGKSVYQELLNGYTSVKSLRDHPLIHEKVNAVLKKLARDFDGDTTKLAYFLTLGPSLWLVEQRLRKFPRLRENLHAPMRSTLLKLFVSMDVWPGVDASEFSFDFNWNIARVLLETGSVSVRPEDSTVACQEKYVDRFFAGAERVVVEECHRIVLNAVDDRIKSYCQREFGKNNKQVQFWELAREIDYVFWTFSRRPEKRMFDTLSVSKWVREAETLKRES